MTPQRPDMVCNWAGTTTPCSWPSCCCQQALTRIECPNCRDANLIRQMDEAGLVVMSKTRLAALNDARDTQSELKRKGFEASDAAMRWDETDR